MEAPLAAVIVPVLEDGSTVLVRQWRHAWDEPSWELPAGTVEEGEDPLGCARRELVEEAGLEATRWDSLGTTRGSAASTMRFHLYLAREVIRVGRAPEGYEQDMVVRELPLARAVEQAYSGDIQHAASIVALLRAANRIAPR